MAYAAEAAERWDEAIEAYLKAEELDHKRFDANAAAASIYWKIGNLPQAAELLRQAIWSEPDNESYLSELVAVYLEMDNYPSALKVYRILQRVDPISAEANFLGIMPP